MSTDFGADSSRRFPFRARTNRQTRLNALPQAGGYIAGVGNNMVPYLFNKFTVDKICTCKPAHQSLSPYISKQMLIDWLISCMRNDSLTTITYQNRALTDALQHVSMVLYFTTNSSVGN